MADAYLKNRHGKSVSGLGALAKKTGQHAGIPTETALYVITAFLDVLVDEVVTNGGATLPGIVTFHTKDVEVKKENRSRNEVVNRYDKDLAVKVSKSLTSLHRVHTVFCKNEEVLITPDTWRDFITKYRKTLAENSFGSGLVYTTKVRKTEALPGSHNKKDYTEISEKLVCDYFGTLVKEMNHAGVYDAKYHIDQKEDLEDDDKRLLILSDLTEETAPYVIKEKIEKVTRLKELKKLGIIKGEHLDKKAYQKFSSKKPQEK